MKISLGIVKHKFLTKIFVSKISIRKILLFIRKFVALRIFIRMLTVFLQKIKLVENSSRNTTFLKINILHRNVF